MGCIHITHKVSRILPYMVSLRSMVLSHGIFRRGNEAPFGLVQGMPFWARQLIAVMISAYAIQVGMDDDIIANEMLVQAQLDMWRV